MKIFEGNLVSQDIKVGIVCARFNEFIVSKLLSGCEDGLLRHLVSLEAPALAPPMPEQLSLFDPPETSIS